MLYITNNSIKYLSFVCTQFKCQTVLFNSLIGATTSGQSEPGRNDNEGVLCIPQSSSITRASPSDYLVSYHYTHWCGGFTSLQRCIQCILLPQLTGPRYITVHMCVHMYICVHMYMCAYVCICMYIGICEHIYVCICLCMHVHMNMWAYMYVCICVCVYTCMHKHIYRYAYVCVYMCVHVYMYVWAYIYMCAS